MIPLIDVIFLLLVVFIFAMLSMTIHKGIRVDLPQSDTAVSDKEEDYFSVSIAADGAVYLDLTPTDLRALTSAVGDRVKEKGKLHVQINAHEQITHGRLVEVLDSIRAGGVTSLSLMTEDYKDGF